MAQWKRDRERHMSDGFTNFAHWIYWWIWRYFTWWYWFDLFCLTWIHNGCPYMSLLTFHVRINSLYFIIYNSLIAFSFEKKRRRSMFGNSLDSTYNFYIYTFWLMFRLWCHHDRPYNKTKRCIGMKRKIFYEKWCGQFNAFTSRIKKNQNGYREIVFVYRLTSSALWAIKNPCVFACIFAPRGLMEILQSAPSSVALISIASKSNFNFVKHNLNDCNKRSERKGER